MIKTFRHKGLETFFKTGSKKGIQAGHAEKLQAQLTTLNVAEKPEDMGIRLGWKLHQLYGYHKGHWAVWVSGNWRLTFKFEDGHAHLVDYQDYH